MKIYGFQKTTLLDFPGHVAATIFTGGCNFRCPFCQNGGLVLELQDQEEISEEEILAYLEKRKGILEGVCITGGEPTLQGDLENFIRKCKEMGYLVKLDTNGYRPEVLEHLLNEHLLDYVAMDVKASPENYAKAAGCEIFDVRQIKKSVELLKSSEIPYEFRTTVVQGIHTISEFEEIGKWLSGATAYFLQAYRDDEGVICPGYETFSQEDMKKMAEIARKYIEKVGLRGI